MLNLVLFLKQNDDVRRVRLTNQNGVVYHISRSSLSIWRSRSRSWKKVMAAASLSQLSFLSNPSPRSLFVPSLRPTTPFRRIHGDGSRFRCSAGQTGFFTRLGRLLKEKAKSDVEKVFSGFSKTRDNLAVIDELLLYWNLAETDRVLDELEEVYLLFLFCCLFWFIFVSIKEAFPAKGKQFCS